MAILFNHAITRIGVHPNYQPNRFECSLTLVENFKKRVGTKYWIFPIYEIIPQAVVRSKGLFSDRCEFVCELKDFKSKYYYFKDGQIYEKPHCTIHMNDKSSRKVHFETVDELNAYVEDLKSKAPHIEV